MIPFTWPAAKLFLGDLPWKKIIIGLAIAAVIVTVVLYIRNAETNRARVVALKGENAALVKANEELEKSYKNQLSVLQDSIQKGLEREKQYATAIDEIQALPDSGCARNSLPIRSSLRLLRNAPGR